MAGVTSPLAFFSLLYNGADASGYVEIRYLPGRTRDWMPWPVFEGHPQEYQLTSAPKEQDVYWGVSLRKEAGDKEGIGGKSNCLPTHLVWTDIDLKDHPELMHGQTDVLSMKAGELKEYKDALFTQILELCAKFNLPPRCIVDSGHGLQVYWARRARSDHGDTERFNRALQHAFGGDTKSVDVARILRLPGSKNRKNTKRLLPVKVIHQDEAAWVEDSALNALRQPEKPQPEAPVAAPSRAAAPLNPDESVIVQWNERNPISDVLVRYGYKREDAKTYTRPGKDASGRDVKLLENKRGVLCSFHHSSNDPLAGTSGDGHLREPFDLYCHYEHGGNFRDAVRAAAVEMGLEHGSAPASAARAVLTKVGDASGPDEMTPQKPTTGVYVEHGCYWIDRPRKERGKTVDWVPEQLTNFVWEPSLQLHYPNGMYGERGVLVVRSLGQHEIQLESKVWNSRKDLLEAIGGYQARCFTTNNSDVAKIGDYIAATYPDLPTATGVKSYGLHKHDGEWVEVYEDQTISTHETPPLFYSGTPVDPGSRAFKAPRAATPEQIAEARRTIIKLPGLVTPAVAYALLGYGAASAFSPRITPHLGNRLPFVYVAGERESGKTSGAQIVLELVTGYSTRLTKASGMTSYQYDLAHSGANNLLALLDEYRPGEVDDAQLRKHHDLGTKWRGSGVASKDHAYELNAPTIVAGEGFTDDAATKSRGVLYFTRKADRGGLNAYNEILKLPVWAYADHLHELARTCTDEQHLVRMTSAERVADQAIEGVANPRLRYALTYIAYGLLVLQEDTQAIPDSAILDTLREGVTNTLEGGAEGITNLELFLEQLSFVLTKVPNPGLYIVPGALPTDLLIRPKACLDLVRSHYKEQAAIANATLLKQYAEQANYFATGDTHKSFEGEVIRSKRITLSQIPERCDADLLEEFNRRMRK